jgi:hypothetical protein
MRRIFAAFAVAVALAGTVIASAGPSLAQSSRYSAGAYDRAVNGSLASTPGQP